MTEDKSCGEVVVGRNAVAELLRSGAADKIFIQRESRYDKPMMLIISLAKKQGVPLAECDKKKLDKLSGSTPHQGVAAYRAQTEYCSIEDILARAHDAGEKALVVICDGVSDVHNIGAIIRSAECLGAHGVIIPKRNSAGITTAAVKASAGAVEHMLISRVANISAAIEKLKKNNVWCCAVELGGAEFYKTDFTSSTALVLGSEGGGVSPLVKKNCDCVISIPMYGHINSLNVSAAAAVVLTEAARQRHSSGV